MHFEAMVMRLSGFLDVKVYEDIIYHHFTVHPSQVEVEYEILIHHGELVSLAKAELWDLQQEDDGHIKRLVIQTNSHIFEVLPIPDERNGRWQAYKIFRKPTAR